MSEDRKKEIQNKIGNSINRMLRTVGKHMHPNDVATTTHLLNNLVGQRAHYILNEFLCSPTITILNENSSDDNTKTIRVFIDKGHIIINRFNKDGDVIYQTDVNVADAIDIIKEHIAEINKKHL